MRYAGTVVHFLRKQREQRDEATLLESRCLNYSCPEGSEAPPLYGSKDRSQAGSTSTTHRDRPRDTPTQPDDSLLSGHLVLVLGIEQPLTDDSVKFVSIDVGVGWVMMYPSRRQV